MKLNIVPASRGAHWVKLGIQTFFRQPLALSGLFFLFLALMRALSVVPVVGHVLASALLPGMTLGLIAAAREASLGKFPMPHILISAFRAGRQQLRAMLVLGALYAVGFMLILGCATLIDGGKFTRFYLYGGELTPEIAKQTDFMLASLFSTALHLPMSLMFWHAPALVHWHGIPPVKSLFFSFVACMRNFWAFTVYGLVWMGVFLGFSVIMATLAGLLNNAKVVAAVMLPAVLLMVAMILTSIYFTFIDSFAITPGEDIHDTTPSARQD